jgi:hypothetical protein
VKGSKYFRECVICGAKFKIPITAKGRPSPRKTCGDACQRRLHVQRRATWSNEEVEIIRDLISTMPPHQFVNTYLIMASNRGLPKRSDTAIRLKAYELGYSLEPEIEYMSMQKIAEMLGVSRDAVDNWRNLGLETHRRTNKPGARHYVNRVAFRRFARKRPEVLGGTDRFGLFCLLENEKWVEQILTDYPERWYGSGKGAKRVKCVETGKVFKSMGDAARSVYVTRSGIFKAVKYGIKAADCHWVAVP